MQVTAEIMLCYKRSYAMLLCILTHDWAFEFRGYICIYIYTRSFKN